MEKALAVLLLPEFSELEAALALEAARRLGLPAYTVAKGRKGTLALAGSVWTPTYAFPAAPQPRALVIPGARRPRERARDPAYLAFLEEVWEGLEAVFVGFNAHLFLEEAGRLPEAVAAPSGLGLEARGHRVVASPWHREGLHDPGGALPPRGPGGLDGAANSPCRLGAMAVREYQKKRRRERIFRAAMELFRNRGFQETTATEIAKAAHVSRGTFFNYYPYKEAVLLDYGSQLLAGLREEVRRLLAQGREPVEVLRHLFRVLAEGTAREKDLLLPMFYELLNPDPVRARAAFEALPLGDLIAEILKPLREQGVLRQDFSLERMGRTLADLYFLSALRWAAYTPGRDLAEELEKNLRLLLEGMLVREAPAPGGL